MKPQILIMVVLTMLAVTTQGQTNDAFLVLISGSYEYETNTSKVSSSNGHTNAPCRDAYFTNWCDRIPASEHDRAVKDLAKGGVICKVMGHSWRDGTSKDEGAMARLQDLSDHTYHRTCQICGKHEIKKMGDWK